MRKIFLDFVMWRHYNMRMKTIQDIDTKRGPGRPAKPEFNARLHVYVRNDVKELLRSLAKEREVKVADVVREALNYGIAFLQSK